MLGCSCGKRLIEVERESSGGAALAVGPDRVVVAPARAERRAERGGEGDEDDACVVVERAHDREVDEDAVGQALLVELLEGALEVGQAVLAAERRNQIAHAGNRLAPAADVRERADGLREDGGDPCLLRARPRELVELDEVAGVVGGKHARFPRLAGAASREQGAQYANRGDRDAEVPHPDLLERFGEQGDDLGVGGGAGFSDELDAHLRHLARFRLRTAFCLAEDAFLIAESEGTWLPREARCAHARDLQRHVGAQREQVAARVEKLERGSRHASAGAHDVHDLERGRLHGNVAVSRQQLLHVECGCLAARGLIC